MPAEPNRAMTSTARAASSSSSSSSSFSSSSRSRRRAAAFAIALVVAAASSSSPTSEAFSPSRHPPAHLVCDAPPSPSRRADDDEPPPPMEGAVRFVASAVAAAALSAAVLLTPGAALAENELSAKYGGAGFDSSLVDRTCLVDRCSVQAKACLRDDPSCRKGLTCTAKCMGDNSCITGCMARYGDENLDDLLKCTIEDNDCIKVAILEGGADEFGYEPRAPAPAVRNFDPSSMVGSWYKVVGFNPNYDCYACQRNTFSSPSGDGSSLRVDVEFSMPHLLPDGSPPPPKNVRERIGAGDDGLMYGSKSVGFNDYHTRETMIFDGGAKSMKGGNGNGRGRGEDLVLNEGSEGEASYARTAHSEGEMFGLKFWENWYIIGENDPGQSEFKFVYYNGRTRQNTYEGAFVYSRTRDLDTSSMSKVYAIASRAGMDPDRFCRIRNGCFGGGGGSGGGGGASGMPGTAEAAPSSAGGGGGALGTPSNPFRGILASTRVSQLLGVEPVAAEGDVLRQLSSQAYAAVSTGSSSPPPSSSPSATGRPWWYEVGDYLENPHRHFRAMDSLRETMVWPEGVRAQR